MSRLWRSIDPDEMGSEMEIESFFNLKNVSVPSLSCWYKGMRRLSDDDQASVFHSN